MNKISSINDIKLTSKIDFFEDNNTFTISMKKDNVEQNMQNNAAAFEAWALILRSQKKKNVILECSGISKSLHCNRFLYRSMKFSENFSWFNLSNDLSKKVKIFRDTDMKKGSLYYNVPSKEEEQNPSNPESKKEHWFVENTKETNEILGLDIEKYYAQLPVGLFNCKKTKNPAIFPRGSAAIDLWGIKDRTFHLIELKTGKNYSLGVISELFFYVNYIYDIHCKKIAEKLHETKYRGFDKLINTKIESVNGYILLEKQHPQLKAAFDELKKSKEKKMRFVKIVCYKNILITK